MRVMRGVAVGAMIAVSLYLVLTFNSAHDSQTPLIGIFVGSVTGGFLAQKKGVIVGLVIGVFSQVMIMITVTTIGFGLGLKHGLALGLLLYAVGVYSALMAIAFGVAGGTLGEKIHQSRHRAV